MRDADGSLIDDDKAVWIQGRATWLLSTLYNTVEKKQELLDGAKLGYDFLNKHCFDILKDSISIYTVVGVLLVIVGLLLSRMNVNKNKVLFD